MIGPEDSFFFKTQDGAEYAPNTRCFVTYKRSSNCPEIHFSCSQFNISNEKSSCKKMDKMKVGKSSYCQMAGPDITTTESKLKVSFMSDRRNQDTGAVCTVSCQHPIT